MMIRDIDSVYFLGIGGIGMSAIARYFSYLGKNVSGYDRTQSPLTMQLQKEGMNIHYTDDVNLIPEDCKADRDKVLVVLTPAIPADSVELNWFRDNGYTIMKRAQVLGEISRTKKTVAISGTHGKTTITTMVSYLLTETGVGCDSFMGGISGNYGTNFLIGDKADWVVVEADEFDRSFHHLEPHIAVITAIDADHLDIYGDYESVRESFSVFTSKVHNDGTLLVKKGLNPEIRTGATVYTYSLNDSSSDYYADNIRVEDGKYVFDLVTINDRIKDLRVGVPGLLNVENSVAAVAAALLAGADPDLIREKLPLFRGVARRFDIRYKSDKVLYIDDYGHHPSEIAFTLRSIRELYPLRRMTVIFQPHLYTRTRDFATEFSRSLSLADAIILLPIYPARELPIEGVDSQMILDGITLEDKQICEKSELLNVLSGRSKDIIVTLGAGDIDRFVTPIAEMLKIANE